ncbi:MAG: hypothetical protein JSR18_01065 [Proteobacteria bacterium]|nr:hypothetical protein [Pseudomonadota bacterium]
MRAPARTEVSGAAPGAGASLVNTPQIPSRLRDAASVLPLVGLVLLMPPMIVLFTARHRIAGVPLIVLYLFGVWVALVAGAALLARRMAHAEQVPGTAHDGGEDRDADA